MSDHDLFLGGFDLIRGEGDGWSVRTIAEGMDFGEADPNEVIQRTLLQDGDAVTIDRYGNRVISYQVKITAKSAAVLATAGALLDAEVGIRNTLTWTPPSTPGEDPPPVTVYDVFVSRKRFDFDDWGEIKPGTVGRVWTLTLTCHPHARDAVETIVEAVSTGAAQPAENPQLVDNCAAIAGWSSDSTITVASGRIRVSTIDPSPVIYGYGLAAHRTGAVPLTDTPFLVFDVAPRKGIPAWAGARLWIPSFGYGRVPLLASGPSPDFPGCTRLWFKPGVAALAEFDLDIGVLPVEPLPGGPLEYSFEIENVSRTNRGPFLGTGRQQFRQLTVGGTARTQGSLQISHETSALGDTLVYTNADDGSGYQPPCRQYRVSGGSTSSDASTVSGTSELINGSPFTADVPAAALPAGSYALVGRFRTAATGMPVINWTASTRVGTTNLGTTIGARTIGLEGAAWTARQIANLTLPRIALPPGSTSKVRITLASTSAVELDELWLFNMTTGALSWINCGTAAPTPGGSSNRLWIDTASLNWPRPAAWLGTAADGSDRRHVLAGTEEQSRGDHVFPPGVINVLTVTPNATFAAARLQFFRRFMDLVAPVEDAA